MLPDPEEAEAVVEAEPEAADIFELDASQVIEEHHPDGIDAIVRAAKAAREAAAPVASGNRICLVVDDSRVIRKLASAIMQRLGYAVVEAENGEEALARCRLQMPAVVVTDWQMPVMSGLEFVSALRQMPEARGTKVVFCTSKGEVTDIHAGITAGADDYLVKPFDEAMVKAKMAKLGLA
ncbi:MAG: response regulator [Erythrobacter sp.]|nr:response regulator [Erythrobacter sp.]